MTHPSGNWTDDRVERLKTMWCEEGLSASAIARKLGGVTRSGVLGKVHRLGLSDASQTQSPRSKVAYAKPFRPAYAAKAAAITSAPIATPPDEPLRLTIMELSDRVCRWPLGEPMDPVVHFCGLPPKPGAVYCDAHCTRAYSPQHPHRREVARV